MSSKYFSSSLAFIPVAGNEGVFLPASHVLDSLNNGPDCDSFSVDVISQPSPSTSLPGSVVLSSQDNHYCAPLTNVLRVAVD